MITQQEQEDTERGDADDPKIWILYGEHSQKIRCAKSCRFKPSMSMSMSTVEKTRRTQVRFGTRHTSLNSRKRLTSKGWKGSRRGRRSTATARQAIPTMVHNPYRHPQATSGCHALFLRKGLMMARHLPCPFAFVVAALCERRRTFGLNPGECAYNCGFFWAKTPKTCSPNVAYQFWFKSLPFWHYSRTRLRAYYRMHSLI